MTLWKFELKKLLFTQRGIWILVVCMLLKVLTLAAVPELKDDRIKLSQKQYDKYLAQLYGENTPEKSDFIIGEYRSCKATLDSQAAMERAYQKGELTEEAWEEFCREYNLASLHVNAAKIFSEKAEQFLLQDSSLPPAHYVYEYGWQTAYTLQLWPDAFLLFGVLLLTAQCFPAEAASGMLPVLLAARNGRGHLFQAKLAALLTVAAAAALVSGGLEVAVFYLRGFLNDGAVPLYSIPLFKECPLDLSLGRGYLLSLAVRTVSTLLLVGMFFGVSVWLKSATNLIFAAICVLVLPLLLTSGGGLRFTHTGLLCGSRMILLLGETGMSALLPIVVIVLYSVVVVCLAARKHQCLR